MIHPESKITLFIDGAARNNPGPAGAGIYIKKSNEPIFSHGYYLGSKTNNEAEYLSLIIGLFYSQNFLQENDILQIFSDSQLLVRQILGIYRIKKPELIKFHSLAMSILNKINYTIAHVPRELNKEADKKANLAIDKKLSLEPEFINFLKKNDISINI